MKPNLTARIDTPMGRFLINRMHELNLEWVDLAATSGLSVEGIKRICIPSNKTKLESLQLLASALKVDVGVIKSLRSEDLDSAPPSTSCVTSQSQRVLSVWEAYLQIAQQVITSDLPQDVKPSTADIATMAYRASLQPQN